MSKSRKKPVRELRAPFISYESPRLMKFHERGTSAWVSISKSPPTLPPPSLEADRVPPLDIAGIISEDLSRKVQDLRVHIEKGEAFGLTGMAELDQRIWLARQACSRARSLAEIALGKYYFRDGAARRHLIGIAEEIIFSPDESVRERHLKKVHSGHPVSVHPFTTYHTP